MTDENKIPRWTVGEIDFSDCNDESSLNEIANVNLGGELNRCTVEVYSNEGQIPHFHITSIDKKLKVCICLFEPLYFNHGSEQGRLNAKQRKKLNSWLQELSMVSMNITNWQMLAIGWKELGNPLSKWKNPGIFKQPDYTKMEYMKG